MNPLFTFVFVWTVMFIAGCSNEEAQSDADRKDHVLRQEMDVMYDARSMTRTANEKIREQNRQADALAGH